METMFEKTLTSLLSESTLPPSPPQSPPEIILTEEQQIACDKISDWFNNSSNQEFKLGGYAGTGKTTVIKTIKKTFEKSILVIVAAFTGKAVNVLNKKGVKAQTLHSLIYNCEIVAGQLVTHLKEKSDLRAKLIIVDESSMLSTELYSDLKSFGIKLLFVGDPGQLEPIGNNPDLMSHPDIVLSKIHRQAEKSPIITLANSIRLGGSLIAPKTDELIIRDKRLVIRDLIAFDQCICAKNKTRETLNAQIRTAKSYHPQNIELGEKIIVLRNNLGFAVFNGLILFVTKIEDGKVTSKDGGHTYPVWFCNCTDEIGTTYSRLPIWKLPFLEPEKIKKDTVIPKAIVYTTFAYVITCHKSQGSEWDKVLVYDEWMPPQVWDMKRWRYTGITRAAKHLTFCK